MQDFQKNQQVQLSDGKYYLYINTITMDGRNYHFLSPKDEDSFIIGEIVHDNDKKLFKIIQDRETIARIQNYYLSHPDALLID